MLSEQDGNKGRHNAAAPVDFDPFACGEIAATAPATEPQQEIWTAARIDEKATCAFNAPLLLELKGDVNCEALLAAYSQLISRHDALRGSFSPDGFSFISSQDMVVDLALVDILCGDRKSQQKSLDAIINTATSTPFNLEFGPLIRGQLIKFSDTESYLLITLHHIICDGWSTGILLSELGELYSSKVENRQPNLAPAPIFADYARKLYASQNSEEYLAAKSYWLDQYADGAPVLDLPHDKARPAERTFNANRYDYIINTKKTKAIMQLSKQAGSTLFITLFAIFQIFLSKRSGQSDLVVGFPAAAQPITGNPGLIGHCVNLLPIRFQVDAKKTFLEHVKQVKASIFDALEHQKFTFGSLLRDLRIPRDFSRIPLVPVIFNLETYSDDFNFSGLKATFSSRARSSETFELFLNVVNYPDKLELQCSYNSDLFSRDLIAKMMSEYECLVDDIVGLPEKIIERINAVSKSDFEKYSLWNDESRFQNDGLFVHKLFEIAAKKYASKTAVICGTQEMTYQQLDARSNQLAHLLLDKGIKQGDFVGLYVDRSVGMLVAAMGVMKSGATYVPMDSGYPKDRIEYIIETASIHCFITESNLHEQLSVSSGDIVICIDDDASLDNSSSESPSISIKPQALGYVIFTSGSTGKPKGVQVPHRAVANLIPFVKNLFSFSDQDILLAVSTLCFDISVPELFLPIVSGGLLIVADQDEVIDGSKLLHLLDEHKVTLLDATPSTWRMLLGAGWQGNTQLTAISTGEALPKDLAEELAFKTGALWNMYGPTETTVWSTYYRIADPSQPILIGKPIGNTQCYVLDAALQVLPIGVPGELFIGGEGVTDGYLGRDDLTKERFIDDPFSEEPGRCLYRTGDLVRWREDGNLEYLHRLDHQVKLRGYRIELEEIETVLASHRSVKQCIVDVREFRPGDQRLVAYVVLVPDAELTITEMRDQARTQLPNYMVPQHLVELDSLPLTPNGKVDRASLPAISEILTPVVQQLQAPETEAEIYLASIWQSELGETRFGIHDNFFDVGGHSLLAAQIVVRIKSERGREIPLRAMIVNTLGQIAQEYLEDASGLNEKNLSNSDDQSRFKKIINALVGRK